MLEKITEEPLLTAFSFILVKQPFISAAAVYGLQTEVVVLGIVFQITVRKIDYLKQQGMQFLFTDLTAFSSFKLFSGVRS